MKRIALLSLMLLIGQSALADGNPNHADIELSNLLPPPPAAGSTAASEDLRAVLAVQRSRTAAEQSAAKADMERSVFRFADVFGPSMQAATLPKTAAFFARVADFDKAEVKDAKTKLIQAAFAKLGWVNALIIDGATVNEGFANAARNIPNIDVLPVQGINVYDILRRKNLVLTKAAVEALEARFK